MSEQQHYGVSAALPVDVFKRLIRKCREADIP